MLTLPLLMLGITAADDPHYATPPDHPAVLADGLHAATNLHEMNSTMRFWQSLQV
jgi:hypothetical protein